MSSKKMQLVFVLVVLLVAACGKTSALATSSITSTGLPSWSLQVELGEPSQMPTCAQMLQLIPGTSTLQDVYSLLRHPERKRDFATGVVIGYPSKQIKFWHTILLDGETGKVIVVGAVARNDNGCPDFDELKAKFGEPTLATMHGNRHVWFFEGHHIADTEMVLQILPSGITLEQYQAQNGYVEESYAFTP
jgi:hypothetical protein